LTLRLHHLRGGATWLSFGALLSLLIIISVLILLPLRAQQRATMADLRETVVARATLIQSRLNEVSYQVQIQREAAEALLEPHTPLPPSPLSAYLGSSDGAPGLSLALVPSELVPARVGNLVLNASAASPDLQRETQMALWLFPLHRAALRTTPDLAWVYYLSAGPLYAVSPWVPVRELHDRSAGGQPGFLLRPNNDDLLTRAAPARNPGRAAFWTQPYVDPASQQLLVSHGAPVYEGRHFRGMVGADLRLGFLQQALDTRHLSGGRLLLVRSPTASLAEARLIAGSNQRINPRIAPTLAMQLGLNAGELDDKLAQSGEFRHSGTRELIAVPIPDAGWWLVYEVPSGRIMLSVLEQLQPAAMVVAVLLLLLVFTYHRLHRSTLALQRLAMRDPLTGAFNRRALFEAMERERARYRRGGHLYGLIMADIDFFKQVNDLYGHAAGDEVLRVITRVLQTDLRDTDLLARVGGEEFVILLPHSDPATALATAERLRHQVEQTVVQSGDNTIQVTISLGVTVPAYAGEEIDLTYQRADVALYSAKFSGRNCSKCFFMHE
jgi:diguanylate cyclase (GGDEF)-like protein